MEMNLARLTLDPLGAQPHLVNFDDIGRPVAAACTRGARRPEQRRGAARTAGPAVGDADGGGRLAREVDLAVPSDPAGWCLRLRRDGLILRFLTTVTAFQAPQRSGRGRTPAHRAVVPL